MDEADENNQFSVSSGNFFFFLLHPAIASSSDELEKVLQY